MVIMLGGLLVYCALLFSFDFYLMGFSIYVYMSDLVRRWIATWFSELHCSDSILPPSHTLSTGKSFLLLPYGFTAHRYDHLDSDGTS
jgi:hypothetical protein